MSTKQQDYVERAAASFRAGFLEIMGSRVPGADPEALGHQAALRAAASISWDDLVGPFTDSTGAANALGGISRQAVSQRLRTKSLLGLKLAGGKGAHYVFPIWQFEAYVADVLPKVLSVAGYDLDRPTTGWAIASWLRTPDARIGHLTPVEMLAKQGEVEVLALARELKASLSLEQVER
jgi:hypothetical protein